MVMTTIDIRDPDLYADWSYEDLGEHINALRELQKRKGGFENTGQKLSEMLDPKTDNFLGSGQTMAEWVAASDLQRLAASFHRADRQERKRRLQYVIQLSCLLQQIEAISIFATAFARGAIEAIIEGDWAGVRLQSTHSQEWDQDFEHLPQEARDLWEAFATVCAEAFDTRPGACAPPRPKN